MKEIKHLETVEVIKTIYYSDDNNLRSTNKEEVELYEANQRSKLDLVDNFYMPEQSNRYSIFKINSKDDLLLYKNAHKDANISFDGFREKDVPRKIRGYFVSSYEDDDWPYYYRIEPLNQFVKNLKESIEEDRLILQQKEDAMSVLEKYKNEPTD